MDSYRTLVTRAQAEFDAGNFERCQTTINAAKALKRQQNSRGGIDLHTKRMLDELGAVGDYDPAYANRDIAGLPASAGGNSWPGQKNFVAPPTISLSEKDTVSLHAVATSRQTMRVNVKTRTKAPTGPIIGQPPAAVPHGVQPLPMAREPSRILDLIPVTLSASAYLEYYATAGGTAAAATAEGTVKPESFPRWNRIPVRATKIAHFAEASDESIQDFANFMTLLTADMTAGLVDAENMELLSAVTDATTHGWNGLLGTSGTLTRTGGPETSLDTLEMAITDLRVGPAFTKPTGIVLNPADWSGIRRSKDSQNRYIATDPLDGNADTLWAFR
jgi:hypothetical protein